MSTLWANGDRGLKSTLGKQMQRTVLFNLIEKVYAAPPSSSRKQITKSAFFHNIASFQVNKCPPYGQMVDKGLKSTSGKKAAESTL